MPSSLDTAARALSVGDALGALRIVALRDDAAALALRGIAMAQLGEHARARLLLRRAARAFGPSEGLARARCVVAEAEVALAMRDLAGDARPLQAATAVLWAHADASNAALGHLVAVRRALLLGRLDEAERALAPLAASRMTPAMHAVAAMCAAELHVRAWRIDAAHEALARASRAAHVGGVPALQAEVSAACAALDRPAAHRHGPDGAVPLDLRATAVLLGSGALVVDGCRRGAQLGPRWVALARRPVLFSLLRALAMAWPGAASRHDLIAGTFRMQHPDDTHRVRLRVEIGRLRAALSGMAGIDATANGFLLRPATAHGVSFIAPPIDGAQAALVALLSDGSAWSTAALALAVGASPRTVQRALAELAAQDRVRTIGRTRDRRWMAPPLAGFTTVLLLPTTPASG